MICFSLIVRISDCGLLLGGFGGGVMVWVSGCLSRNNEVGRVMLDVFGELFIWVWCYLVVLCCSGRLRVVMKLLLGWLFRCRCLLWCLMVWWVMVRFRLCFGLFWLGVWKNGLFNCFCSLVVMFGLWLWMFRCR